MTDSSIRLDKWLWFARLAKSRSLAARLCTEGRIRVNRIVVTKPATALRLGDILTLPQGGQIRVVRLVAIGLRRGPAAEARCLYEDLTSPSKTPLELPQDRTTGAKDLLPPSPDHIKRNIDNHR